MGKVEALQNHSPEAIIVDEVSGEEEISACKRIRERGVQLIASTNVASFEKVLKNPQLASVVGGAVPTSRNTDDNKSQTRSTGSSPRRVSICIWRKETSQMIKP